MRSARLKDLINPLRRVGLSLALLLLSGIGSAQAQLEVTEIMFNPNNDFIWEWIEVRNTGASAVNLDGYVGFSLNSSEPSTLNPTIDSTLADNTTIGAGEVAVIYDGNQNGFNGFPSFDDAKFREAWGLGASVPLIAANFWPTLSNNTGSDRQSVGYWASIADYQQDLTPIEEDPENEPGVFTNRVTSFDHAAFSINYSAGFPSDDGMSSIAWSGNGSNQNGIHWSLSQTGQPGVTTSVPVQVPGLLNNTDDTGNPGIAPPGTPSTTGLHITEILYDSAGAENDWEWVEIYNSTGSSIDLSGYVIDDINGQTHDAANIASGSIGAGETAILFNVDDVSMEDFATAWGAGLNLVPVTGWDQMSLNNGGDTVGLWDSFSSYSEDHQTHANAVVSQVYDEGTGFPTLSQGPSISLADLSFDPTDGGNWDNAVVGDFIGSFNAMPVSGGDGMIDFHPGGDIGSPGTFVESTPTADVDGDGDVDGYDFLQLQRSDPTFLDLWQSEFGNIGGGLSAVPEPASWVLLSMALTLVGGRSRR